MKNKKIIIIGITIAIVLLLVIFGIFIYKKILKNKENQEDSQDEVYTKTPETVIKSTSENPIEKNGIEVTNIKIFRETPTSVQIDATIYNRSDKTLHGFFIEIGLYDVNGKYLYSISKNHKNDFKPNEKYLFHTGIGGDDEVAEIASAKIISTGNELENDVVEYMNSYSEN